MIRAEWEFHPNENRATLHCDRSFPEVNSDPILESDNATEDGKQLLEAISGIHGIVSCSASSFDRYSLSVGKGTVFTWEEIQPRIESIVSDLFNDQLSTQEETTNGKAY